MRTINYRFQGHLSDKIGENSRDTPDGCPTYLGALFNEFQSQGFEIHCPNKDKDAEDFKSLGKGIFKTFMQSQRVRSYEQIKFESFSDSAAMSIFEWRWIIYNKPESRKDWEDQYSLIVHSCLGAIPVYIFDLDHKLDFHDEKYLSYLEKQYGTRIKVIETSHFPEKKLLERISVPIPCWNFFFNEKPAKEKEFDLGYIGNDYERAETILKHIIPAVDSGINMQIAGKWTHNFRKDSIKWHGRVGIPDFNGIYQNSVGVPLMAKPSYYESGFVTARLHESLQFGSVPIGFKEHKGLHKEIPAVLIVDNLSELRWVIQYIKDSKYLREDVWNKVVENHSPKKFISCL